MRNLSDAILAVYLVLNGAEWLFLFSGDAIKPFADRSAVVLRMQDRGWPSMMAKTFGSAIAIIGPRLFATAIIVCGFVLFSTAIRSEVSPIVSATAFLLVLLFNSTIGFGLEGSDQMAILVLFANAAGSISPNWQTIAEMFIFFQLVLSYGVAGVAKLLSRDWRNGDALPKILSSRSLGIGQVPRPFRDRRLGIVACWVIIVFEIAWFSAPFGEYFLYPLLAIAAFFHLANNWLMGLNLFSWAFISAYPLAINASRHLHS